MNPLDASRRISLHLVRGFWVAARHLSFTRAATELYVTQSAISREVKALEEQLGQPLFRRVNRTLQLTQAGEELYQAVDEALGLIDAAVDRLTGSERVLAITASIPFASLWLAPRLPRFVRRHPGVDLRIAASNEVLDLAQAHLDVAIRYVHAGGDTPRGELLVPYETFPVCAPALLDDPERPLRDPSDLARHVLLEFEAVIHGRPWYDWDQWFRAKRIPKVKPAGRQRFSHYDQVVEAALAGSGVAIGKRPHLNGKLQEGALRPLFGPEAMASLGAFHVVIAPASAGRKVVGAFVAWLKEEVRRDMLADAAEPLAGVAAGAEREEAAGR